MSDERLRELERAWHTSGELEDEVAYLTERHRTGATTETGLRMAAWMGYLPAKTVLGPEAPETLLPEWINQRATVGIAMSRTVGTEGNPFVRRPDNDHDQLRREFDARLTVALARSQIGVGPAAGPTPGGPHDILAQAEAYIVCPCYEHDIPLGVLFGEGHDMAQRAARAAASLNGGDMPQISYTLKRMGITTNPGAISWTARVIRESLTPHLLGYGDPLVDRSVLERIKGASRWEDVDSVVSLGGYHEAGLVGVPPRRKLPKPPRENPHRPHMPPPPKPPTNPNQAQPRPVPKIDWASRPREIVGLPAPRMSLAKKLMWIVVVSAVVVMLVTAAEQAWR